MKQYYLEALQGVLASSPSGGAQDVMVITFLSFPINIYSLTPQAERAGFDTNGNIAGYTPIQLSLASPSTTIHNLHPGDFLLVIAAHSGGLVGVMPITEAATLWAATNDMLSTPNDMGRVPSPSTEVIIPGDSPRVVVGSALLENKTTLAREQYWQRLPTSYSLAPGETRVVSYTVTSGLESTSSDLNTIAASLGMSASAGWGPVSASISASLSTTSTRFQQQTYTTQTSTFNSQTLENKTDAPQMMLIWQLTDVVTIFDPATGAPLASVITGGEPVVMDGPYNLLELPPPLRLVTMTEFLQLEQ